uniref:ATPase AAA-type core domain-containing protein n=1 Tax=Glossina morsitans morsitans TaxID=37546 RepID=A0A1B0FPQ5_GLOMM
MERPEDEDDGAVLVLDNQRDLVGVNKDSYLILKTLPAEYDARVKAMDVDERPTEQYSDIGGLHKQIQDMIEAVVLPMTHKDKFKILGIQRPKGVLLYGPPGTGKTLLAKSTLIFIY